MVHQSAMTHKKKHTTRNLFIFIFLLLSANILSTQYIAYRFDYHPDIGTPLYSHAYQPFAWIGWMNLYFEGYKTFFTPVLLGWLALAILTFILLFISIIRIRSAKGHSDVHGTARWAEKQDIENMSLIKQKDGVYIGSWKDKKGIIHALRHAGPEHIMAFAPTRSGKGVGLVLPTLLSWPHSTVILDIKGENWELTSGWRQKYAKNKVIKFDPTAADGSSVKFNPLEEIRIATEYEVSDTQNLAIMIIDHDGEGLTDFWRQAGFSFLVGLILHVMYKAKNSNPTQHANLSLLYTMLNDPSKEINEVLEDMLLYKHIIDPFSGEKRTHQAVASAARELSNMSPAQLSGVVGSVSSNLGLYADPIISRNISKSEFKIDDIMNSETPVSLYLVIKPTDMDRLKPLTRIVINQILRILIKDLKFKDGSAIKSYKHRLLLMLDEFTSLGKLDIFQSSLAYMAGYGIKSYIIIQDLMQLYEAYTKEESILSNCHVRIAYAPNKIETAELLSKMVGTTTVVTKVTRTSGSRFAVMQDQVGDSYQEIARPLLTPDECMTLPGPKKDSNGNITEPGDMLIFIAGNPTVYGKQILYFQNKTFLDRAKVPSPNSSDVLNASNSIKEKDDANIYIQEMYSAIMQKIKIDDTIKIHQI